MSSQAIVLARLDDLVSLNKGCDGPREPQDKKSPKNGVAQK